MPHAESPEGTNGTPIFYVNDGPLAADQVGYLTATTLDCPVDEMRRRYHEDGYLFLKGLLPREDVLKAREEYFKMLPPTGVLAPGTQPVEGIFDSSKDHANYPGLGAGVEEERSDPETAKKFTDLAVEAHSEDWYKDVFCKHPALQDFVAKFTGWGDSTLAVTRTLLRNNTPGNKAIGVHYDQIFLRHGEDTSVTAWVPMGDVSIIGGGLIYLETGHQLGTELEKDFTKKAESAGMTDEQRKSAFNQNMLSSGLLAEGPSEFSRNSGRKWLVTDYEAGDVVLHTAYTIHASTINHDPSGKIRLGTDIRFVDTSRPWDERWANVFRPGDGV